MCEIFSFFEFKVHTFTKLSLQKIFLFYDDNFYSIALLTLEIKNDFKGVIEAYNIVERWVKSNNKTPFHRKILIFFADNI